MSGLKINFHKGEVVALGVDKQTEENIANMLNCKVGQLPMKYLGFPISDKRLGTGAFSGVVEKMRHRLQPWKGKNLTSRGRQILTNTLLCSMPTYLMGMFQLYGGTHQQMDSIRANFFWGCEG
jgi:hypothetical protein